MEEKERYEWNSRFDEAIKDNQTGDIVNAVEVLNKQDKRIKELEEENNFLKKRNEKLIIDRRDICLERNDIFEENQQLKQQLHDLPKNIVEDITNELSNNTSLYFEIRESTSAYCPNKEYEWFNYVRFRNYINAILKKYGDKQ